MTTTADRPERRSHAASGPAMSDPIGLRCLVCDDEFLFEDYAEDYRNEERAATRAAWEHTKDEHQRADAVEMVPPGGVEGEEQSA